MANFYTSFTLPGARQGDVAAALRAMERTALVTKSLGGSVVVFDEECDDEEPDVMLRVGADLSRRLGGASVLGVANVDDDVLRYWLFQGGELRDQYNSWPGYYEGDEAVPEGGDARLLAGFFGQGATPEEVEAILRDTTSAFAMDRHSALVETLGLPTCAVGFGYRFVSEGELPEDLDDADVVRVG